MNKICYRKDMSFLPSLAYRQKVYLFYPLPQDGRGCRSRVRVNKICYNKTMNKFLEYSKELRKKSQIPEQIMWSILRNRRFCNLKFRRQFCIGNYIVDFICLEKRLIIGQDYKSGVIDATHVRMLHLLLGEDTETCLGLF